MKDKIHNDKEKESRGGFTLIEMMIVIAIIGILATIVIRSFVFLSTARDSKRISDIRTSQNYLELYYNANGSYPNSSGWSAMTSTVETAIPNIHFPAPVNTNYPYCYTPTSTASGGPLSYIVGAQLENDNAVIGQMPSSLQGAACSTGSGSLTCGTSTGKYVYCISPQ
ncbi:MAG: type II secretion system GspH family protein [Patescibacteria group bacterium]|nr:type II secretion system GspH family protein [Patescibacteria group bacterium]